MRTFKPLLNVALVMTIAISCNKKDDRQPCNDATSDFSLEFTMDHQTNNVTILASDLNLNDDCADFDFLIKVAPLNGAKSPEEIDFALFNNPIYNQRIVIQEEGVKKHSVNLANLDETDGTGELMIYAAFVLKIPLGLSPREYVISPDFNENNFKMFYFGVYEGGDAPDATCTNCTTNECDDGTVYTCTCFNGFCYCRLCPTTVTFGE